MLVHISMLTLMVQVDGSQPYFDGKSFSPDTDVELEQQAASIIAFTEDEEGNSVKTQRTDHAAISQRKPRVGDINLTRKVYEKLVVDHYNELLAYARPNFFHGYHFKTPDDIVAQAYLKLWRASITIYDLPAVDNPRALLYSIVKRLLIDDSKRLEKQLMKTMDIPEDDEPFGEASPRSMLYTEDIIIAKDKFERAFKSLDKSYQIALYLHELGSATYEEIADYLNLNPSGMKMYLSRARRAFWEKYNALD